MDLPSRRVPTLRPNTTPAVRQEKSRYQLNEQQVDALIHTGSQVAGGVVQIAQSLLEISRINVTTQADVARIEASSRALVDKIRAEIDRLRESHQAIRTRGETTVSIIQATLQQMPEADRLKSMPHLEKLVTLALQETGESKA